MQETINISEQRDTRVSPAEYVVAIGASAGGLEAINEFFDNLSSNTGLAFIIIQHLSPDYKSLLVELVGKHTHMKVMEAEDSMPVEKNCVYVIPNKKLITIKNGRLLLEEKALTKSPNTAIDFFLYTLAKDKGNQAIAVILSGTGTDGTKGIEKIKSAGGMVMVQDPATAKFDGMPNSAIISEKVDYILPPELMPAEIYEFVRIKPKELSENTEIKEGLFSEIFALVHRSTGWDFNYYRRPTIFRRINKRMIASGFKTLEEYVAQLRHNDDECAALSKEFLIGVTKFFRDKAAFDVLENEVFPELIKSKENGEFLKIWISACSTGEEAYSIAILLDRYLSRTNKIVNVKYFATDIDQRAIEIAGKGWYGPQIENDIEPEILNKYFVKDGSGYCVTQSLRKQIVFACHNLIKDPPFIKNDLISCRNMLIYLDPNLQKKVISIFNFSLNNNGFLFLGLSESISGSKEKMEEVSNHWKIYKKSGDGKAVNSNKSYTQEHTQYSFRQQEKKAEKKPQPTLNDEFKEALATDFGHAGIYIDKNYEVKEAVGNYRKYLSFPEKLLNLNILKMVPKDLSAILSSSLRQSARDSKKMSLKNVKFSEEGKHSFMNVFIKPPTENTAYFLLIFSDAAEKAEDETTGKNHFHAHDNNQLISDLESELKETKLNLQTVIEELEITNEELQSTNEELLSSNEELQSSNEELQSLNEELHTLNTEHQIKIRELIEVNNDLDNYFRTTEIGQIFLDDNLHIRKFNSAAVRIINLIETDVGRPINHISTNIKNANLLPDIESVIQSRHVVEKEIVLSNNANCLLRISPYLLPDKKPFGAVITFVDISALKDLDNIIKGIFNSSINAIMAFKAVRNERHEIIDFKYVAANYAAEKLAESKSLNENKLLSVEFPNLKETFFSTFINVVEKDKKIFTEYTLDNDDQEHYYDVVGVKMGDGMALTFIDVSEKKEAENRLKRNFQELNSTKEKLRKLNNELENKVAERTKELTESEERFRLVSKASNDLIWDWNLSNNEVWYGENYEILFGYKQSGEQLKRQFWLGKIHPEEQEKVKEVLFKVINNAEDSWSAEYRVLKADGNYATVFDRGFLLKDEYGTPFRMVGSLVDVTRLRIAEKEAEANNEERKFLAETIPLIVWTTSPTGSVTFINNHFKIYTGKLANEAMGNGWKKVVFEEDYPNLQKAFKKALNQRQDFSIEIRIEHLDKQFYWHVLRARAKKDEQGKLLSWVGTLTDIHAQKQATAILEKRVSERTVELKNAVQDLEVSNNSLKQFAYVASHDLKEPLRKISLYSSVIRDKFSESAQNGATEYLNKIISSSERLTRLIVDLLSFSTISSNSNFEQVNFNQLLEEVLSDLELAISEKKAVIHVPKFPEIEAVNSQMRQVFQNIIGNALKFTRKEVTPVIDVSSTRIKERDFNSAPDENGHFVRIGIKDNGIGFEEKFIDKMFMIFQRLHPKNQFEGTGIGLAITKSIVDKHHGIITANSKENEGSAFIIVLPLTQSKQR